RLLVLADSLGSRLQLTRVPLVDAAPGHAECLPILQTDGVDEHQMLDLLRMEQRVPDGEHSAGRMSEQRDPSDAKMFQEGMRVRGQLLEAVLVALRLARLAETDLIGRDDAPAHLAQRPDGGFPRSGAEVLPVQQHDRPSVGAVRSDVQVAHVQLLPLRIQIEALDGPRVIEAFELGPVCGRVRTRRSGGKCSEESAGQAADDHVRLIPPGLLERNNCGWQLRAIPQPKMQGRAAAARPQSRKEAEMY